MTRARWMLGAAGALATMALGAALPASAAPAPDAITEITNAIDRTSWDGSYRYGPVRATQFSPGATNKWILTPKYDGSVTIQNVETRLCAQPEAFVPGAEVVTAPCNFSDVQDWRVQQRPEGTVLSPEIAPELAASVYEIGLPGSPVVLKHNRTFDPDRSSIFTISPF
ncbi:hypothetical protein GCM10011581_14120 [Saccharopolyspora subtropica]|uniref:Ricin B lectin domain-containing protein n=1 Tax=Saccharopolyspora thermophila TaxID=89367 RepID=A0A917JMZ6_9PSEU|nr:RICIN domain-containing protein [Saccharopolyspora subtropica]GGI78201.1 hypothetical protein GCM10011581_14120 [Saccharopolyspora subtropica]